MIHVLHHRGVGQLSVAMPLVEEQLGHADRFFGAAVLRNEQQREILPRRSAATAHEVMPGAALNEHAFHIELHVGEELAEDRLVDPVSRRRLSPEQSGLREHERAAAGAVHLGALRVHAPDPVDQTPVEHRRPFRQSHDHVRHEHHIGLGSVVDRVLRNDADTGDELERARLRRDKPRLEQAALGDTALHGVPHLSSRPQRVEHAVDDRRIALGKYRNTDADSSRETLYRDLWLKWLEADHSASHAESPDAVCRAPDGAMSRLHHKIRNEPWTWI